MGWTVDWKVEVDGQDVSLPMASALMDIEVTDKAGSTSDTCSLTLDNANAQIRLPRDGAAISVALQGVTIFTGTLDQPTLSGSRGGGRIMKVSAKGFDTRAKAKQGLRFHKDDASFKDFMTDAAKRAGFTIDVDSEFGSMTRDYWASHGESFVALGERMARDMDATFKLRGKKAVFVKRGKERLAAVQAIVGDGGNVISFDISPYEGRPAFTKTKVRYFDRKTAKFIDKEIGIDLGRTLPEATDVVRTDAADEAEASMIGEGRKGHAKREQGSGTLDMDLTLSAQAEAPLTLTGAGPGADGAWIIDSVTHRADRSGGATTTLSLKQPGSTAGKDSR